MKVETECGLWGGWMKSLHGSQDDVSDALGIKVYFLLTERKEGKKE